MQLTFLGTGTSHGIPVIGCNCSVCRSKYLKNKRTRSSILIESDKSIFIIDTSTDFRTQGLREGINKLDFVLFTHPHADHVHGLDDLRPLTSAGEIPVYGNYQTICDIKSRFSYITKEASPGGGIPRLSFNVLEEGKHKISDLNIVPIPVKHGALDIYGYRIGNLAYITDCSFIPEHSWKYLHGIEILIIGALRYTPHATHFSVDEAVEIITRSKCRNAWITHMCHNIEHKTLEKKLPDHIRASYDGLKISFEG